MARIIVKLRDDYVQKNNTATVYLQLFRMKLMFAEIDHTFIESWEYHHSVNDIMK